MDPEKYRNPMMIKITYRIIAIAGLLILLIPAWIRYSGDMTDSLMKNLMFIGTLVWFAGAIPWLGQKRTNND
jgi:nitrate/nitrite transporter NarK